VYPFCIAIALLRHDPARGAFIQDGLAHLRDYTLISGGTRTVSRRSRADLPAHFFPRITSAAIFDRKSAKQNGPSDGARHPARRGSAEYAKMSRSSAEFATKPLFPVLLRNFRLTMAGGRARF
jgi:hypothetical protein